MKQGNIGFILIVIGVLLLATVVYFSYNKQDDSLIAANEAFCAAHNESYTGYYNLNTKISEKSKMVIVCKNSYVVG